MGYQLGAGFHSAWEEMMPPSLGPPIGHLLLPEIVHSIALSGGQEGVLMVKTVISVPLAQSSALLNIGSCGGWRGGGAEAFPWRQVHPRKIPHFLTRWRSRLTQIWTQPLII